jgi:hypothetical protein
MPRQRGDLRAPLRRLRQTATETAKATLPAGSRRYENDGRQNANRRANSGPEKLLAGAGELYGLGAGGGGVCDGGGAFDCAGGLGSERNAQRAGRIGCDARAAGSGAAGGDGEIAAAREARQRERGAGVVCERERLRGAGGADGLRGEGEAGGRDRDGDDGGAGDVDHLLRDGGVIGNYDGALERSADGRRKRDAERATGAGRESDRAAGRGAAAGLGEVAGGSDGRNRDAGGAGVLHGDGFCGAGGPNGLAGKCQRGGSEFQRRCAAARAAAGELYFLRAVRGGVGDGYGAVNRAVGGGREGDGKRAARRRCEARAARRSAAADRGVVAAGGEAERERGGKIVRDRGGLRGAGGADGVAAEGQRGGRKHDGSDCGARDAHDLRRVGCGV